MKKAVSIAVVIFCISSILLYVMRAESHFTEETGIQGEISEIERAEEEKLCHDEWEMEHVESLRFYHGVTQDDINRIGLCHNLRSLYIVITDEKLDLSPLSNLVELETIDFVCYSLYEIDASFLSDLARLKEIFILQGNIKDYSFFYSLQQLREVYITRNDAIDDLSFFSDMPCLESLSIDNVDDADLSYLANLNNIEKIHIGGYHVRNLEELANLSHIKELSLCEYDAYGEKRLVFDLHILDNMTKLESLSLLYINIEDISPLADKQFLRSITLVDTGIEDIEPLWELDNLHWLWIYGNKSEKVKEQSEMYFNDVEDVDVSEEIPNELRL